MITVNIFDSTCQHHLLEDGYWTSTAKKKPLEVEFVQQQYNYEGITLFTDGIILSDVVDKVISSIKVAWCLESPAVQPFVHNNLQTVEHKFDYILTYREDLIHSNPLKYIPNSPGGTYILDRDINLHVHEKNKLCSIILSNKNHFEGHQLRHIIYNTNKLIDGFGSGTTNGFIYNKIDALKNYMFSVIIENTRAPYYFTEKLIDCLLTGCVPIYWGPPNIDQFFNIEGFVIFNSYEEFTNLQITEELFKNKQSAIAENFELAKNYISSDDYMIKKLINHLQLQNEKN